MTPTDTTSPHHAKVAELEQENRRLREQVILYKDLCGQTERRLEATERRLAAHLDRRTDGK